MDLPERRRKDAQKKERGFTPSSRTPRAGQSSRPSSSRQNRETPVCNPREQSPSSSLRSPSSSRRPSPTRSSATSHTSQRPANQRHRSSQQHPSTQRHRFSQQHHSSPQRQQRSSASRHTRSSRTPQANYRDTLFSPLNAYTPKVALPWRFIAPALLLCLIIGGSIFFISGTGQGYTPPIDQESGEVSDKASVLPVSYELNPLDVDTLPASNEITPFNLAGVEKAIPALSEKTLQDINTALAPFIEDERSVGFTLINLDTGSGIGYNLDDSIYGASSFKGPYCTYICEELIEKEVITATTPCAKSRLSDYDSYYASDPGTSYPTNLLIEDTLIYSENNAFGFLRDAYDGTRFNTWLASLNISSSNINADGTWFPHYSTRDATKLWMETGKYLNTKTSTAAWLSSLFGKTETSYIRDALSFQGTEVEVLDKAGWCVDYDDDYDSICDSGIVVIDGTPYLISVMSGMPDSENNVFLFQKLILALFEARESL